MDRRDEDHQACIKLIEQASPPLIIPAPVLVEVEYFVTTRSHMKAFLDFLDDVIAGFYAVEALTAADYQRVRQLCDRYEGSGIGLVDASVLAVAERLNIAQIATLDRKHFSLMRPRHVDALTLLP